MDNTEVYEAGYDANFEVEPPDYLKCVICSLVLRHPVMFVDCGHRFCKGCYEKMKVFAKRTEIPLLCPHDRQQIEAERVVEDKGIARVALDLKVKCDKFEEGCEWTGDLRDLKAHVDKDCQKLDVLSLLAKLTRRLEDCENRLNVKDSQISNLEAENHTQRNNLQGFKDFKKEELKHLNKRFAKFEELIAHKETQIQKLSGELKQSKTEIEQMKKTTKKQSKKEKRDEAPAETPPPPQPLYPFMAGSQGMMQFPPYMQPPPIQQTDAPQKATDDLYKKIKGLQERIMNVSEYIPHNKTVFEWALHDYGACEEAGDTVFSPIFYSHLSGHSCKLELNWHGKQNGRLSIALVICKGIHKEIPHGRFSMAYTFETVDGNGQTKTSLIPKRDVQQNFKKFFIAHDETESEGYGDEHFLSMPALRNYVIKDVLKIKCTLWKVNPS